MTQEKKNTTSDKCYAVKALPETLSSLFFACLRGELTGEPQAKQTQEMIQRLTLAQQKDMRVLAQKHDLAHILASAFSSFSFVQEDGQATEENTKQNTANTEQSTAIAKEKRQEKHQEEALLSLYRALRMQHELATLGGIFEQADIAYIPLKGSILATFYPKEGMRLSADIDILVRAETFERATGQLLANNYKEGVKSDHDIAFFSPADVPVELHFILCEGDEKIDAVLCEAWEHARSEAGCRYGLSPAFFLFYHVAHMAKHVKNGGCGIRPFMDLYIIEKKMKIPRDTADALLVRAGLKTFAESAFALADVWFSDKAHTPKTKRFEAYILGGEVYGTLFQRVAMRRRDTSQTCYFMRRLFPSFASMKEDFPRLEKRPFLMPFYWVLRVFNLFKGKRVSRRINEVKINATMSKEEQENIARLVSDLGLFN